MKKNMVTKNFEVIFHIVAQVHKKADIESVLKKETEWMGESESCVVIGMNLKKIKEIKNNKNDYSNI